MQVPSGVRIDERAKFGQHRRSVYFTVLTIQDFNRFACPGQLGIERDQINIFFKSPARGNVFLQTRNVAAISTEYVSQCCC